MWLGVLGAVLVVAAAAGGIAWAVDRSGGDGGGDASSATCREQVFPAQKALHVPPAKIPKGFEYNSFPPTSGPHHPSPAVWNVYDEPVAQNHLTHNLEHGGIVIQYGEGVSRATIDAIVAWYREDPNGIIVAPLPDVEKAEKLRDKITLAAWWAEYEDPNNPTGTPVREEGRLLTCTTFDEDAFSDFRDTNRAHGPEPFELEQLPAGSQ
jgi:hypothetical protein